MRSPTFAVFSLLLLGPELIKAAPHDYARAAVTSIPSPRPWRKLSDAIIGRIWGIPEHQKSLGMNHDNVGGVREEAPGEKLRYGEDIVMRFTIRTPDEAAALAKAARTLFLDVWEFNHDWADIRTAKKGLPSLLRLLPESLQTAHVPLMQDLDLAQAILDSYPSPSSTQSHEDSFFSTSSRTPTSAARSNPFFQDYQPLSVIVPWMNLMASLFSTHVRKVNIGMSYEGRDIPALRVGVHPTNPGLFSSPRKTILITGGSHAREWISTSTVNYVAWSMINSYGKDHTITKMLEAFDFVFIPTLNPDGYVYSWETDRLWRKNRQPTSWQFCQGVDLDRSYSYKWDGNSSHSSPCSESFAGDAPFEGVESQRFAEWAKNETEHNNVEFLGFIDLHSYSQQILYPYSFTCEEVPPTVEDLQELALGLAKAIRISRRGRPYMVSSACEGNVAMSKGSKEKDDERIFPRIESSGGSALDWFYHELKVKYAFQIKLRDRGTYGFLLPKENIIPTGKELVDAVLYLGHFLLGEVGFVAEETKLVHPDGELDIGEIEINDDQNDDDPPLELRRRR